MMLKFTLMLFLPCLILADTQEECTGGDISCPEGKTCCTIDDKPSCCDAYLEATHPLRSALLSAPNNMTDVHVQHEFVINPECDPSNCPDGVCCEMDGYSGCCHIKMGICCPGGGHCCKSSDTCCGTGCCSNMTNCCGVDVCCPTNTTCCGKVCCRTTSTCCPSQKTCCPTANTTCCGDACCPMSYSKCCGKWCCKSDEYCGKSYKECTNAGALLSPAMLMTLIAVWIAVYVAGKM